MDGWRGGRTDGWIYICLYIYRERERGRVGERERERDSIDGMAMKMDRLVKYTEP